MLRAWTRLPLAVVFAITAWTLGGGYASASVASGSDTHIAGFEQDYYLYYNQQWCGNQGAYAYQITEADAQWYRSTSTRSISSAYMSAVQNGYQCNGHADYLSSTFGPFTPDWACGDNCWSGRYILFYNWPYDGFALRFVVAQVGGRDNGDAYLNGSYQGSLCVLIKLVGNISC